MLLSTEMQIIQCYKKPHTYQRQQLTVLAFQAKSKGKVKQWTLKTINNISKAAICFSGSYSGLIQSNKLMRRINLN